MCEMHYYRFYRHGDTTKRLRNANGEGGYVRRYFGKRVLGKYLREHVVVAERALGRVLPRGVVVHHIDENPANNALNNLVICPNQGYHNIIHGRMKAFAVSGDANKKPCKFCGQYDDVVKLVKNTTSHYHKSCRAAAFHKRSLFL